MAAAAKLRDMEKALTNLQGAEAEVPQGELEKALKVYPEVEDPSDWLTH